VVRRVVRIGSSIGTDGSESSVGTAGLSLSNGLAGSGLSEWSRTGWNDASAWHGLGDDTSGRTGRHGTDWHVGMNRTGRECQAGMEWIVGLGRNVWAGIV
jgi:hypothetical protein